MDKKEISSEIDAKIQEVYKILRECEELAEKHQVTFSFSPAYGMGGTYIPRPERTEDWESSNCYGESNIGWQSSSQGC